MAALEGEERLMIVFVDVHYFFAPPSPRPVGDRFEKGSYLYLYGNKSGHGARLEVANNAGTPAQDAFTGSLDTCRVRHSHKHPTLCTVSANAYRSPQANASSPSPHAISHWRLPNLNPTMHQHELQLLHTVDLYFWTTQDAETFVGAVTRLLQAGQIERLDQPQPQAPRDKVISPVVQQLEKAVIQDASLGASRTSSSSGTQATAGRQQSTSTPGDASTFQPLPYNPAAPAAPEAFLHREKTPPPIDAEAGTGLSTAAQADAMNHAQAPPGIAYVPQPASIVPSAVSPSQSAVSNRTPTAGSLPPPPPLNASATVLPPNQQPSGPAAGQNQTTISPSSHSSAHQPMHHVQPQYADYLGSTGHQSTGPIGGYSTYSYSQQQPNTGPSDEYGIHGQLYRPTEEEANRDPRYSSPTGSKPQRQQTGKLDQQANRVDKGVNRFFKKIEKKIG